MSLSVTACVASCLGVLGLVRGSWFTTLHWLRLHRAGAVRCSATLSGARAENIRLYREPRTHRPGATADATPKAVKRTGKKGAIYGRLYLVCNDESLASLSEWGATRTPAAETRERRSLPRAVPSDARCVEGRLCQGPSLRVRAERTESGGIYVHEHVGVRPREPSRRSARARSPRRPAYIAPRSTCHNPVWRRLTSL